MTKTSSDLVSWLLAPLSLQEISIASSKLPDALQSDTVSIVSIDLFEPKKQIVVSLLQNNPVSKEELKRQAQILLLDRSTKKSFDIIVDLASDDIYTEEITNAQLSFSPEEYELAGKLIRSDKKLKEILEEHGIDIEKVVVDLWAAGGGYFGEHEEDTSPSRRLGKPILFYRENLSDNVYSRPIRGITPVIDLFEQKIIRIDIYDKIYVPKVDEKFYRDRALGYSLKPLHITQPDGPSFSVDGYKVNWAAWEFRIGFETREGFCLRTVSFRDPETGEKRPILYKASMAEMVVPYGDPSRPAYRKNAFDVGEDGMGRNLNSLTLGCDCVGEIHYFDVHLSDHRGNANTITNAICMHEEDYGLLYKHTDWRTGDTLRTRSRRLVISCFATVANYDYGFNWHLYLDGRIEFEVKMTGIVSTETRGYPFEKGSHYQYGTTLGRDLYAPIHQHFFSMRLDFMVDGTNNRFYEVTAPTTATSDPRNRQGNAFSTSEVLLEAESNAVRDISQEDGTIWKVSNGKLINGLGYHPSYAIYPEKNSILKASEKSSIYTRAAHLHHHIYCTAYSPDERYPGGRYPNMRANEGGLPNWIRGNRSLVDEDIVVWYNFGTLHIVRPEEWPLMPLAFARFELVPFGFFERNPALYRESAKKSKL